MNALILATNDNEYVQCLQCHLDVVCTTGAFAGIYVIIELYLSTVKVMWCNICNLLITVLETNITILRLGHITTSLNINTARRERVSWVLGKPRSPLTVAA